MAITILPRQAGLGELLGTALGTGLGTGLQELYRQRSTAKGLQALGLSPEEATQASFLPPNILQDVIKGYSTRAQDVGLETALAELRGEPPPTMPQVGVMPPVGVPPTPEMMPPTPPEITPTEVVPGVPRRAPTTLAEALRRPTLRPEHRIKIAEMQERKKAELRKISREEQKEINQETLPVYKETNKAAKAATESDMRLSRMEELNERGRLGIPIFNTFLKTLKKGVAGYGLDLTTLMTADAQEMEKLSTDFLKNVKDIFGARISQMEVQMFLQTVPTLVQNKEGRRRVIRNLRIFNEGARLRQKAMNEIIAENIGRRPRNLESLIEKRIKPQLDSLAQQMTTGPVATGAGLGRGLLYY